MRRAFLVALASALASLFLMRFAQGGEDLPPVLVARTEPLSPEEQRKKFHLPPGFDIELVAAEPQINKPINIAFDDRNRIWVTSTIEYPFPAPPDRKPRDAVKILEDTDGDGRADKVVTFADGLNIPIGILPLPVTPSPPSSPSPLPQGGGGSKKRQEALVFSIPHIHKMTDEDGDGVADKREVLYSKFGFIDTHGMASSFTWGFDGWVYACHGFANTSEVKDAAGNLVKMQSGNTFRMKADGSRIEQFTWGQVNPFGLSFDSLGNLFSADCHSRPLMMLLRGGYYQSFGKPHDGLGFAPEICKHDHGSTGIAGVVIYEADHFPPEYRGTVFIGNPITNRINHDRLKPVDSTLVAEELPDFLKCDDPWFRPVDLKLGPDGALYVADFYNRIIGHYEVPLKHPGRDRERGRIWRIVYRGKDGKQKATMPRADWSRATTEELANDLGHANLSVRVRAANQLVLRDPKELAAINREVAKPAFSAPQRAHCLWVRERKGGLEVGELQRAAADPDRAVRIQAMRVLAERPKLEDALWRFALAGLRDDDPFVQRAAADALSRHADERNLSPLLEAYHQVRGADTQLVHTVRMALRNQLLALADWSRIRGHFLKAPDAEVIADVALGVRNEKAVRFLWEFITSDARPVARLRDYTRHIARHGSVGFLHALPNVLRRLAATEHAQGELLKAIHQGLQERGMPVPAEINAWAEEAANEMLKVSGHAHVELAAELTTLFGLRSTRPVLQFILVDRIAPESKRIAAIAPLLAHERDMCVGLLGKILNEPAETVSMRERTAQSLAGVNRSDARRELVKALPTAPARVANAIAAGLAGNREGAEELLKAIGEGKASPRLLQEQAVRVRLQQSRLDDWEGRVAKLTAGLPPADQKLQELLNRRRESYLKLAKPREGDGEKIFEKHCAACHQLAGKGAKIGPQLDGIGNRGLDRLLEDLIDPNRNIDQAFRASTLLLKGDRIVTGLILREEGEVVILADAQGKEQRVPKKEIDERSLSPLSPMPANLIDQIPEADFNELLAYLLAQRQAGKKE